MTLRQCYEFALIESNKLKAPSILLEDFIYLFNKAIQQYVNGVYNRAEYNQQSSDDLGVLQTISTIDTKNIVPKQEFNDTIWEIELPNDYIHLLNCMAEFTGTNSKSICGKNDLKTITSPCQRLTADMYPGIINNYYMRPSHKKPYYHIITRNPENKILANVNTVESQSIVKLEIHSGNSNWKLDKLYITYLKTPKYISMTQEQILAIEDDTPILEFPDYVCYEIINIYIRLFLENASDPRLQTNIPINQTIAVPGNK